MAKFSEVCKTWSNKNKRARAASSVRQDMQNIFWVTNTDLYDSNIGRSGICLRKVRPGCWDPEDGGFGGQGCAHTENPVRSASSRPSLQQRVAASC